MIPLLWIFFVWVLAVGFFLLLALFTVSLAMRFGLTGMTTYILCGIFLLVSGIIIFSSGSYLLTVDWTQTISLIPAQPNAGFLLP